MGCFHPVMSKINLLLGGFNVRGVVRYSNYKVDLMLLYKSYTFKYDAVKAALNNSRCALIIFSRELNRSGPRQ